MPTEANSYFVKAFVEATANYAAAESNAVSFKINQKTVTISGITAGKKTFDNTTTATLDLTSAVFTGKVGTDELTVSGITGTFDTPAVGPGKIVTLNYTGATLGGASAGNYIIATTGNQLTTTADITADASVLTNAPEAITTLKYSGTAQNLVSAGTATNGTVQYRLEGGSYSETIPTGTAAETYKVYYKVVGNTNYADVDEAGPIEVTIGQKAITITGIKANDKDYDGTVNATLDYSGASFGGIVSGDNLTVTATGQFADKNVAYNAANAVIGKDVTISGLTLGGTSVANYQLAATGQQATASAKINPKEVGLTWSTTTTWAYDEAAHQPTASVNSSDLVGGDACTVNVDVTAQTGSSLTTDGKAVGVGSYTAKATALSNANYKLPVTGLTQNFTITAEASVLTKAPEAITTLKYSGTAQGLVSAGTATNGTMQYRLEDGSYSETIPTGTAAETYKVYYKVVGNTNYADVDEAGPIEVTIGQKAITITGIKANDKDYDGTVNATLDYSGASFGGIVSGDNLTVTATGQFADKNVAYNAANAVIGKDVTISGLTLGGTSVANYQLAATGQQATASAKINPKEVGLTWSTTTTWAYDEAAHQPTASVNSSDLISGDVCTVQTYSLVATSGSLNAEDKAVDVGSYTVTATALSNANYKLPTTGLTQDFTITAATGELTFSDVTKTYGDNPFTVSPSEVVSPGEITYTSGNTNVITIDSDGKLNIKAQGTAIITAHQAASGSYSAEEKTFTVTVKKKEVTLKWEQTQLNYTGLAQAPIATVTNLINSDECDVTIDITAKTGSSLATDGNAVNVGSYTAKATALNNDNYALPETAPTQDFTINKVTVTVRAQDAERKVGEADPTFGVSFDGFVNGENEGVLTSSVICNTNATATSPAGSYTITPSGGEAANYDFTYDDGTLTIYQGFSIMKEWRTWYGTEDLTIDATDVETYVVTAISSTAVTVQSTNGNIFKDTPMLLKRKNSNQTEFKAYAPTATLTPPTGLSTQYVGGVSDLSTYATKQVYVLAGSEFVKVDLSNSTTFDTSKCFLWIDNASARLRIVEGEVTRIDDNELHEFSGNDVWYTIDGRKLDKQPTKKGLYIKNGKKVAIKQ